MDNQKDIEKRDESLNGLLSDKSIRTQPFGNNHAARRLYRRTERVSAAIYLITNHVSATEPLRERARKLALELMQNALSIRDEMRAVESRGVKDMEAVCRQLISVVRMFPVAGLLSAQNAEILISAIDDLGVYMHAARRSPQSEQIILTPEHFSEQPEISDAKGQNRSKVSVRDRVVTRKDRGHNRRDNILSTLGSQGRLGIREIAANLPEYSEKMIQRELKDLVEEGKVAKEGAKRWSVYKLA